MSPYPSSDKYSEAVQHPETAFTDLDLRRGTIGVNTLGLPVALGGGFALTYTVKTPCRKYAVRCFHKKTDALEERYRKIDAVLSALPGGPFVKFEFQPQGVLVDGKSFPIVKMEWAEGPTLGMYLETVYRDRAALEELAQNLERLQAFLARHGIAHGDIQNGNVIVTNQGITLIDYDGMFVPGMAEGRGTEIGHPHWQHRQRSQADFGPRIDRFSFIMLKVSLAALTRRKDLFEKYNNAENLLFTANDYADPNRSRLFRELRGIPEIARDVATFAELCAAPVSHIPDLLEFGRLTSGRTLPVAPGAAKRQSPAKGRAPYIAALPVVPASDYSFARRYVGDRVELIGQIVQRYRGHDKNSEPYLFLNFAPQFTPKYVKAIIWPSGMRAFGIPPDKSWEGKWVSVTGLLDPPYSGRSITISVTITSPSQLHQISEEEARYRLHSALPGQTETEDEEAPVGSTSEAGPNEQVLARILRLAGQSNTGKPNNPSPPLRPAAAPATSRPRVVPPSVSTGTGIGKPIPSPQLDRLRLAKSAYSGKTVRRGQLLESEKPPGRLGLPDEFGQCEVTGKRLLLDELDRSVVSKKLVDRDLLIPSARSSKFALADEMVNCEESGIKLLPTETARCSVTGKMVDASLLLKSELSGRVALKRLMRRCALTQDLVLFEELEQCHVTKKWVLPSELETCAVTGVRALRQGMLACDHSGKWILPSEAQESDYSGKMVARGLLLRSEKLPGRLGLPDEFALCEVSGRRLLTDEVDHSVVSNKLVDRDLLVSSARSGKLALADEMVTCEESGIKLLPAEAARCSITGKLVDSRLLSINELSGQVALTTLMRRCGSTGKLVPSQELERCGLSGKFVLASELETCAVTGMRGLRRDMLRTNVPGKYLLPRKVLESELFAAFERGEPYLDTYLAITWAAIARDKFEAEALGRISRGRVGGDRLSVVRDRSSSVSLRCLLLRAAGRSWDAAREAAGLMDTDPNEARRIIRAVASELESPRRGRIPLPLEATRMRCQLLGEEYPRDYPVPELQQARGQLPAAFRSRLMEKLRDFLKK